MKLDMLIRGGVVYDGVSQSGWLGDVGVRDGRIVLPAAAGRPGATAGFATGVQATRTIDATGLAVFPGFIDIHTHSEIAWLAWPNATSKLMSGCTTDVAGNCGGGAFPMAGEVRARRQADWDKHGLKIDWTDAAGYFARLEATPCGVNRAVLVGHGNLRGVTVGYGNARPTPQEMSRMRERLAEGLRAGAFGMSTGLIYPPGIWADAEEITALVRVVAEHGGFYSSHIRGEGETLLEAVDEYMAALEAARCRGVLSHVKTAGRKNWHKIDALRERFEAARARGLQVLADRYPYTATCTGLSAMLLPRWAVEGTRRQVVARLKTPAERQRIEQEIRSGPDYATIFDDILVIQFRGRGFEALCGKSLTQIGRLRGQDPLSAALDLLVEDGLGPEAVHFCMSEDNLCEIYRWPWTIVGSDYSARDAFSPGEMCHPRAFGTPAAFLGHFVRERKVCDLPTAARKLATMAADLLGLHDRGRIAAGCWADLVVLDPSTIADRATYQEPCQTPVGIHHVLVNGVPAVENGRYTGALAGHVLRKPH